MREHGSGRFYRGTVSYGMSTCNTVVGFFLSLPPLLMVLLYYREEQHGKFVRAYHNNISFFCMLKNDAFFYNDKIKGEKWPYAKNEQKMLGCFLEPSARALLIALVYYLFFKVSFCVQV